MVLDAVVDRFIEHSPISVMARLGLQRALDPAWIDELFEQERETQYTRELLFSTTVEIMSLVAVGLRPSVHAAAKASPALPGARRSPRDAQTYAGTQSGQEERLCCRLCGTATCLYRTCHQGWTRRLITLKGVGISPTCPRRLPGKPKAMAALVLSAAFREAAFLTGGKLCHSPWSAAAVQ
uniref:hypothetical protein n=1 Tax=Cupriavidus ulmosensis TaxID=3065913 RepID=UPI003F828F9F